MYKIEYNIGLNEHGRPCIELPEDYEHRPEDRFFVIEVARWMLQDLLTRRTQDLDQQTVNAIDDAERLIGQIGDEVAAILYEGMKVQGELDFMLDKKFHIIVNSIEERDALPDKDILYDNKIFDRVEGLCVRIQESLYDAYYNPESYDVYKLVDGITNEHWEKI